MTGSAELVDQVGLLPPTERRRVHSADGCEVRRRLVPNHHIGQHPNINRRDLLLAAALRDHRSMKLLMGIALGTLAYDGLHYALSGGFRKVMGGVTSDKTALCLEMVGNTTTVEQGMTYIIGSL